MEKTMLIIDEDKSVLNACQRTFTKEGYTVTTTTNPAEGLELAGRNPFTIILCDWQMPGFDGMDVVGTLETDAPESALVIISGSPSAGCAVAEMRRGGIDYLAKPFTPAEIVAGVEKALSAKLTREKNALSSFEKMLGTFPVQGVDDKVPKNIAETVAETVGVTKATSPWFSLFVLGVMAGAYVGFGGLFSFSVTFDMPVEFGVGLKKLISGAAFSIGLMLVIIAGAELFTGNTLMVSSVMTGRVTWPKVLASWGVVYIANFIGSIIIAILYYYTGLWKAGGGALGEVVVQTAHYKVNLEWVEAFVRAIGCNWLVCLAVWMALAARQTVSKIAAIFFIIAAFVAIGFEHCVANMFFIPSGIFLVRWAGLAPEGLDITTLTWGAFFVKNLVPVTIGNIIGGVLFVGLGYWGAYLRQSK